MVKMPSVNPPTGLFGSSWNTTDARAPKSPVLEAFDKFEWLFTNVVNELLTDEIIPPTTLPIAFPTNFIRIVGMILNLAPIIAVFINPPIGLSGSSSILNRSW